jgi:cystathionine beta-lyase/cystathionine gamma-synthase
MIEPRHISTECAHAGEQPLQSGSTPAVMPIYQTTVYDFPDLEQVDEVWDHRKPGFIYGRYGLPNHAAFEEVAAKLEGAEGAVATASGMAAIVVALCAMMQSGEELVVANDCYGGTLSVAARDFPRLGIASRFVPTTNLAAVEKAFAPATKVLLVETLSNPLWNVLDVGAVAEMCHRKGVKLLVDNTVATPYLIRPLSMNADVVIHSASKFLGGHHDVTAGIVVADAGFITRAREVAIRMGPTLSPFDAWLTVRGIKTFALRMGRICSNALAVAEFLEKHRKVRKVYYAGLAKHPNHEIVRRTMRGLGGGMVSFELNGDMHSAENFVKSLGLIRFAPSFGGVTTTISHPAKTSHRSLTPAQRSEAGISDTLLRLSIGIEEAEDIVAELQRILENV